VHERTPARATQRNGTRDKRRATTAQMNGVLGLRS
jgi:hypothetical protein